MRRVDLEIDRGVARLRLDDPASGNALSPETIRQLRDALRAVEGAPGVRALVLSAGGEGFGRGLDLEAILREPEGARAAVRDFAECLLRLVQSPAATIAAVDGDAAGGSVGLAAACDLVIASRRARFALPEVLVGLVPAVILPVLLRRMTRAQARALALSTRWVEAPEALAIGLVTEVVDGPAAPGVARQLRRLKRSSPDAVAALKRLLDPGGGGLQRELEEAGAALCERLADPAVREGAMAFADGMAPPWFAERGAGPWPG